MDMDDPNAPPVYSGGNQREVIPENLEQAKEIWKRMGYRGDDHWNSAPSSRKLKFNLGVACYDTQVEPRRDVE